MEKLFVKEIAEATGASIVSGSESDVFDTFITDSRKISYGCMFIPIKGEMFDGHDFIDSAIKSGAKGVLTQKDMRPSENCVILKVRDTKKALGDIARYYKKKLSVPSVAVTGSVGKTTTKDMIYFALSEAFNAHRTNLNFNNDIGVPFTVFGLESRHNMLVCEMGMNHFGEIRYLSSITMPDVAAITNIGLSHIENLGSQEGILKAKLEVTENMKDGSVLVLNGDDKLLSNVSCEGKKIVYYGIENKSCDFRAEDIELFEDSVKFNAVYGDEKAAVTVRLPGEHNVYNALCAIACAHSFGVSMKDAARGIYKFESDGIRLSCSELKKIWLIDDCYNASPASVDAAVSVLCGARGKRKVAVLGDIKELGDYAPALHGKVGKSVARAGVDVILAIGDNCKFLSKAAIDEGVDKCFYFKTVDDALCEIENIICEGDAVLVKASHSMHFERITAFLKEKFDK